MALKRKISKTDYDALPEVLKAEYKASGSDYVLDTDDAAELMSARDREREARREAERKAREVQEQLAELTNKRDRENGDIAALEASWKAKFDAEKKRADEATSALEGERRKFHVDSAADKIAKRFTVPGLVKDVIAKRLKVEMDGDAAIVRVLDKDGKPSALSLVDLEKEFVDNPEYKAIVVASQGRGSAVTPGQTGGSAPGKSFLPSQPGNEAQSFAAMSAKDFAAHLKATDNEA